MTGDARANADADANANANADAEAYAHRAIVEATLAGVIKPRRGLRVVAGASAAAAADLLVMTDDGRVDDARLADAMKRARGVVGDAGAVAIVVGSRVAAELVGAARHDGAASAVRDDAYARGIAWARERSRMAHAVSPERLVRLVEAAAASGLTLVEPETGAIAPALARVRGIKSPRARALLATIALGARARPLLFVPTARAPKNGLARLRVERLSGGWVAASRPSELADRAGGDLVDAALALLGDAARAERGPLLFKELLREARERWSTAARTRGERVTASAGDVAELATALHRRAASEDILLYVLDPADPGWTLTTGPAGPSL